MYTKENLVNSLNHEFRVIKHLFEKLPHDSIGYKPTEKQRTTLELLQYISMVAPATIELVKTGDTAVFTSYVEESKSVTQENFLEVFGRNTAKALNILSTFTDETLKEEIDVFRMGKMTKGVYLVETILKWIVAYKMQLFLYAKASGNHDIGTSNVWGGFDMPKS